MRTAIVLPLYNEEDGISELVHAIEEQVASDSTFVFVDDGSRDETLRVVRELVLLKAANSKRVVKLSRNFGHQSAVMAGLHSVPDDCDRIVVMDADFQDHPRDLPRLLSRLEEGYDCVYAVRNAQTGSRLLNLLTLVFYRLQKALLRLELPLNAGTFCVFNRRMLEGLRAFSEREIYFPGLRAYVGMRQTGVSVRRERRAYGKSRVGFLGLVRLAMDGLIGFSALPMRLIMLLGLLTTLLCLVCGAIVLILRLTGVVEVLGFTSTLIFILGLFGVQIMFTGLVGEYIGRLFVESKGRPPWIVHDVEDY